MRLAFRPCHNQASWQQANCQAPETRHANAPVIMLIITSSHMRRVGEVMPLKSASLQ